MDSPWSRWFWAVLLVGWCFVYSLFSSAETMKVLSTKPHGDCTEHSIALETVIKLTQHCISDLPMNRFTQLLLRPWYLTYIDVESIKNLQTKARAKLAVYAHYILRLQRAHTASRFYVMHPLGTEALTDVPNHRRYHFDMQITNTGLLVKWSVK
jgi:hypothetical protein